MTIQILERIKDQFGNIRSYVIQVDGSKPSEIDTEALVSWKDNVVNAHYIEGQGFKANKGYQIKTTVRYKNLLTLKGDTSKLKFRMFPEDYYGKGFESVCRKIRKYASLGRITIDRRQHKFSNNLYLIEAIESCGVDSTLFITGILQNIQPYSLSYFQQKKEKKHENEDIWLLDIGYKVKLVLKFLIQNNTEMLVISFHESIAKERFLSSNEKFDKKLCAVFIRQQNQVEDDMYSINYTIQRGFIRFEDIYSYTKYVNDDLALVKFTDFNYRFADLLNREYMQLSELYNNSKGMVVFQNDSIFSFLSYGVGLINNVSLLIDMFSEARNTKVKMELINITESLISEIPSDDLKKLRHTLISKYGIGYNNNLYKLLLDRG